MANRIQKNKNQSSAPAQKRNGGKRAAVLFIALAAICAAAFAATRAPAAIAVGIGALFAAAIAFFISTSAPANTNQKTAAKYYGDFGEQKTGDILEHYLPEDYTLVQNLTLHYAGGTSEIDTIVIGKSGVFIVEIKNVKGTIRGDYADYEWLQDKIDRYGIEHPKNLYNPTKQVGTHIWRLAKFLRENKIDTYVQGAVYFANPESALALSGEEGKIPVFSYRQTPALLEYIHAGNAQLSAAKVQSIVRLLDEI